MNVDSGDQAYNFQSKWLLTSNTFLAGEIISIFFDINCHCEHPVYRALQEKDHFQIFWKSDEIWPSQLQAMGQELDKLHYINASKLQKILKYSQNTVFGILIQFQSFSNSNQINVKSVRISSI